MSFGTKTSMWWGTVKGSTEKFFGKEQKRMITHEYYDNPSAPSQRPKSMHTIASQSRRSLGGGNSQRGARDSSTSRQKSSSRNISPSKRASDDGEDGAVASGRRSVGYQGAAEQRAMEETVDADPVVSANAPAFAQDGAQHPQEDPNMMGYGQQGMVYPQGDPNMMGYGQQGMMYGQQDPTMMGYDAQGMMMGGYQQQGMYPQDQNMGGQQYQ